MWHIIPCMLLCCWPQPPERSSSFGQEFTLTPESIPTWIWSGNQVAWSRCGCSFRQSADAGGRRRDSRRRTSTGVCSSWRWPAGIQKCAPVPDPGRTQKSRKVSDTCVCARALLLASRTQTWSSSSTTTSVSRLLLKSSRVILGLHGKNNGLYISDVIAHLGPYIVHQQQHHVKRPQDKKKPCSYSPTFLKYHKYQSTSEHINHLYVWFIKVSCCSSSSMTADNAWKFDSTHMTLDSDRIWT